MATHHAAVTAPVIPRFVGRTRQLRGLQRALARPPAVVLVEGEPGIGKSRLVREWRARHDDPGLRVAVGSCSPHREPATLAPVVEAVRGAVADPPAEAIGPLAGSLRPLFPEWADRLPPAPGPLDSPHAARHRMFRALGDLIAAADIPVLVVEDVHWADDPVLEFLLSVAARPHSAHPVSLVVTYRPEDVPDTSLLRRLPSGLPAGTTLERVVVPPLDLPETVELISSMVAGRPVPEEIFTRLHEHAAGVPLAIEESVRLLAQRFGSIKLGGPPGAPLPVPPTVRETALQRLRGLGQAATAVLHAAAVLAEPADETLLAHVAGLPPARAAEGAAQALGCGLLREAEWGRLGFRHPVTAAAVYESMSAAQRRRLHRRAGRALSRHHPLRAAKLARHFREAGELVPWLQHAEQAADQAVAASAHSAAVELLGDLVSGAHVPLADRARLAVKLGRAVMLTQGSGILARGVVPMLRELCTQPSLSASDRAQVGNVLGRLLIHLGEPAEAFAEIADAAGQLSDPMEAARGMVLLGSPLAGHWSAQEHLRWLRRVETLPLADASAADRLSLTVDRASALLHLGSPAGWRLVEQLPERVDRDDERLQLARGRLNVGDAALLWGHYELARELLLDCLAVAEAAGYRRLHDCARANLLRLDWLTGKWTRLGERAAAMADDDSTESVVRYEGGLLAGLMHLAEGSLPAAEHRLTGVLDQVRDRGPVEVGLATAAVLGRVRLTQGRADQALAVTEAPVRTVTTKGIWVWATELAPVRTEALLHTGRTAEARELVIGFGRGLRARAAPAPRASLRICRAMLTAHSGDPRGAATAFGGAARAWQLLPQPYERLLAEERRAGCLLAAADERSAVSLLSKVADQLRRLGAIGDAARVEGVLAAHGVLVPATRPGRWRGYGRQLSPREQEVVRLVATGRTNREIAAALSKSPRTVDEQLRSAMRKLGVASRTALAVAAVHDGAIPAEAAPPADLQTAPPADLQTGAPNGRRTGPPV